MFENNDFEIDSQSSSFSSLEKYTLKTFMIMALGLLITAVTAYGFLWSGLFFRLYFAVGRMFPLIMLIAQLGVVFAFSAKLFKANISTVRIMFFAYAILTGMTFSSLCVVYTMTDISMAFGLTCLYFGALVVIGRTTHINLSRFAPILFTGLIVLIIFNVVGFFINLDSFTLLMSSVGLIIFTGITAYDAQKMKKLYYQYEGNEDMLSRLSMYSALDLYLDFINIFLYILRILGNRK